MRSAKYKTGQFSKVLDSCYAAAWDSTTWPDALSVLGDYVGAQAITLESYGPDLSTIIDFQSAGIDLDSTANYVEYYQGINPRHPMLMETRQGELLFDNRVLSEREIDKSEFYCDLLKPAGMRHFLSSTLIKNRDQLVLLAEHISVNKGHATPKDIQQLNRLAPYYARAYSMCKDIGVLKETVRSYQFALEHLDVGVMMLNNRGALEYVNLVAERLCQGNPEISLRKGGVELLNRSLREQYGDSIKRVVNDDRCLPVDSLFVPGSVSTPFLQIDFLPARGLGHVAECLEVSKKNQRVMLVIRDIASRCHMPDSVLERCFALTVKEMDLAKGLVKGDTLSSHAEKTGVKITTVRTHFTNLRSKLGARNQSDVVRVLMPLMH